MGPVILYAKRAFEAKSDLGSHPTWHARCFFAAKTNFGDPSLRPLLTAVALSACAAPALADPIANAGDMSSAYGMTDNFTTPIDPSTSSSGAQSFVGPSPLEGTLSGGLMDQSQTPGSYRVVGDGRFVVITLTDGRTLTVDTLHPNDQSQSDANAQAQGVQ